MHQWSLDIRYFGSGFDIDPCYFNWKSIDIRYKVIMYLEGGRIYLSNRYQWKLATQALNLGTLALGIGRSSFDIYDCYCHLISMKLGY